MIPYQLIWAIMLLPLGAFVLNGILLRPFVKRESKLYAYTTILAIGTAFAFAVWALVSLFRVDTHQIAISPINWLVIGDLNFKVGIIADQLSIIMTVVVTLVSLMVQIYSIGYMHGDEAGYYRYYTWMSLFTFSMLGLVLASSFLFTFVFWEMVGLCSYLLIGFWFHKKSAADAAKKAFITTRVGDFGFLAGLLVIFFNTHTFNIAQLHTMALTGAFGGAALTWACIGLFAGAIGKSAQFPLHVWLPDAMEGPTPVSALIHSATMVCAGVFLVARAMPMFVMSESAITTVATIGAFSCIFAAIMGLVATDIKRVLAYSTISQIGYMMLGLGAVGMIVAHEIGAGQYAAASTAELTLIAEAAVAVGLFHLFTHAYFKSLLFLGSGSVNHSTGTFDMRLMGGLKKTMPWTYWTFVIASLSLAGIWPLAGFWSKDQVLGSALQAQPVLFWLGLITVFLTAFYIFRAVFMTFHGEYKGGDPNGDYHHTHESPKVMVVPLFILAALAFGAGWWNLAGGFDKFFGYVPDVHVSSAAAGAFVPFSHFSVTSFSHALPVISLLFGLSGIFAAYAIYIKKWVTAEAMGKFFGPLYTVAYRKFYFDEFYEGILVKKVLVGGLFKAFSFFDRRGIDGVVNEAGALVTGSGKGIRKSQSGQLQLYGLMMGVGVAIIALVVLIWG